MTVSNIPQSAVNPQPHAKNSAQNSKKTLTREERLKGDIDFSISASRSLLHCCLNSGQTAMVSFFQTRCRTYGYCQRDKALKDFLAHYNEPGSKRHMTRETAQTYLRAILRSGRTLEITGANGRNYLIADESPVRMREVRDSFLAELRAEAEYQDELRRAQAEKAAQDEAAWADLLAYTRAEGAPADEPAAADPDKNFADGADFFDERSENIADGPQNFTESPGKFCKKGRKTFRKNGKTLRRNESKTGGESSLESPLESSTESKNETTTESEWPCDVEESRACEDTEREDVVFFVDNFDEENTWGKWNGEYADADAPDDVQADEDLCDDQVNIALLLDITRKPHIGPAGPLDNDPQQAAPAPAVGSSGPAAGYAAARQAEAAAMEQDPFADDDAPVPTPPQPSPLELAAQAVEDSLGVTQKAVQKAIQAMQTAGDSDEQITLVLKKSRESVEAKKVYRRIKSSVGGTWVNSVDGIAAELRSNALKASQRKKAAQKARQAHAESAAQRREREETQRLDQETDKAARRENVLLQSHELLISAFAAVRKIKPVMATKFSPADHDLGGRELIQKMAWPTFLEIERAVNAILNQGAPF